MKLQQHSEQDHLCQYSSRQIKGQIYTVSQKKGATLTMAITLSILDRFPKFFHYCRER